MAPDKDKGSKDKKGPEAGAAGAGPGPGSADDQLEDLSGASAAAAAVAEAEKRAKAAGGLPSEQEFRKAGYKGDYVKFVDDELARREKDKDKAAKAAAAKAESEKPAEDPNCLMEVTEDCKFNVGGHIMKLAKGRVINTAHYKPGWVKSAITGGAKLRKIEKSEG